MATAITHMNPSHWYEITTKIYKHKAPSVSDFLGLPCRLPNLFDKSGKCCVYSLIAFPLRRREWRNNTRIITKPVCTILFSTLMSGVCSLSEDKATDQFAINCQMVGVAASRLHQRVNSAVRLESLEKKPQDGDFLLHVSNRSFLFSHCAATLHSSTRTFA